MLLLAAVLGAGVLTVGGLYLGGAFSTEIRLEPVNYSGPDPFTNPVGADVVVPPNPGVLPASTTAPATAAAQPPGPVVGNKVGLYGGTGGDRCDRNQMIAFLQQNPAKATAWAAVIGIPVTDIPRYVSRLAEGVLLTPTSVTNHGFRNNKANRVPAVLQPGTRVFIDDRGRPVAKCACGNPLSEGAYYTQPKYSGQTFPGFDPNSVTVVTPSPKPLTSLSLKNITTGQIYQKPVGGGVVTPAPPTAPASPTTAPPAPSATVVAPPPPATVTPVPPTSPATVADPLFPGTYVVTETLQSCNIVAPCTIGEQKTYRFTIACSGRGNCTVDGRPYTRNGTVLTSSIPVGPADELTCNNSPEPTTDSVSLDVSHSTGSPSVAQSLSGQRSVEAQSSCGLLQKYWDLTYTRV